MLKLTQAEYDVIAEFSFINESVNLHKTDKIVAQAAWNASKDDLMIALQILHNPTESQRKRVKAHIHSLVSNEVYYRQAYYTRKGVDLDLLNIIRF